MAVRPKVYSLFQRQGRQWVRIHSGFWGLSTAKRVFSFFLKEASLNLQIRRAYKDQEVRDPIDL